GRHAAARHAGLRADAEAPPPTLDEPSLHPSRRADTRGRAGVWAPGRRRHSSWLADTAPGRGERRRRDRPPALSRAAPPAREALLPLSGRSRRRDVALPDSGEQGPRDD